MSSSVDQRNGKGQDQPVVHNQTSEVEYAYSHGGMTMQGGYPTSAMAQGAPSHEYAMYPGGQYSQYMQFSGGLMPDSGVWSADPSNGAISYGSYGGAPISAGDYVPYGDGSTEQYPAQYDYTGGVNWFPGFDYGAAWGPGIPVQGPHKSRMFDYGNGYYEMDRNSGGQSYGQSNGVHVMEQNFKSMQLSDVRENKEVNDDSSNADSVPYSSKVQAGQSTQASKPAPSTQKKSWANIASQPAKTILPRPKPQGAQLPRGVLAVSAQVRQESTMAANNNSRSSNGHLEGKGDSNPTSVPSSGQYNPKDFDCNAKNARYFVIKSFSEDDIHRSIKFSIWCSTEYGNKRLDSAFKERDGKGPVFLFFSVNGSGHFCGVAQMISAVDYDSSSDVWAQDKWKGVFKVKWIFVKDVPNSQLRHIRLENNEGKPVTNSRDTQEVLGEKGKQVLRIIHQYRHTTSIFDDFNHYEKQLEEKATGPN